MNKRILAVVAVLALVGALVPGIVFAAQTTVTCTVSAVLVSLTVTNGSVAYGTVNLGTTKNTAQWNATNNTNGMNTTQTQTITNTGTVQEDFRVKSSNATGATNWTLAGSAGSNTFTHGWNWASTKYNGVGTLTFTNWTAADSWLVTGTNVTPAGVRYLELQIGMPTSVTDYGTHNITVTVEALQSS